jgi:hypothetical protein
MVSVFTSQGVSFRAFQALNHSSAFSRRVRRVCPVLREIGLRPVSDHVIAYRPRHSHLSLLGHFQRVVHFYTEIADRAFELCMT